MMKVSDLKAKQSLVKARNSIRNKFRQLRSTKLEENRLLEEQYNPITKRLGALIDFTAKTTKNVRNRDDVASNHAIDERESTSSNDDASDSNARKAKKKRMRSARDSLLLSVKQKKKKFRKLRSTPKSAIKAALEHELAKESAMHNPFATSTPLFNKTKNVFAASNDAFADHGELSDMSTPGRSRRERFDLAASIIHKNNSGRKPRTSSGAAAADRRHNALMRLRTNLNNDEIRNVQPQATLEEEELDVVNTPPPLKIRAANPRARSASVVANDVIDRRSTLRPRAISVDFNARRSTLRPRAISTDIQLNRRQNKGGAGAIIDLSLKHLISKDSGATPSVPYTYWNDPNELVARLRLLAASASAGHAGHQNEIISIIEELREADIIE